MKPILFNTEMVRAILEGRKTVTRRVVKLPSYVQRQPDGLFTLFAEGTCYEGCELEEIQNYLNMPFKVNDVLYVRETWSEHYTADSDGKLVYCYKADNVNLKSECLSGENNRWYPSIHMPKEAARIFLRVTDVRVERLHDMSTKEDFKKEGIYDDGTYPTDRSVKIHPMAQGGWTLGAYRERFEMIWNSTIKCDQLNTYGWDANPYVWVIEFERITKEQPEMQEGE